MASPIVVKLIAIMSICAIDPFGMLLNKLHYASFMAFPVDFAQNFVFTLAFVEEKRRIVASTRKSGNSTEMENSRDSREIAIDAVA